MQGFLFEVKICPAHQLSKNGVYSFFAAYRSNELDYETFYQQLPENEAFVLVKNEIAISDILQVCFKDGKDLAAGKAALSDYNTSNFAVDSTLFTNSRI